MEDATILILTIISSIVLMYFVFKWGFREHKPKHDDKTVDNTVKKSSTYYPHANKREYY